VATIEKRLLSASTNGRMIQVTTSFTLGGSSNGNLIHTAVSGTTNLDEVHLFAVNNTSSDSLLVIQYGNQGQWNEVRFNVPGQVGLIPVVEKLLLQNSLEIRAYSGDSTANAVNVGGYVNRITA